MRIIDIVLQQCFRKNYSKTSTKATTVGRAMFGAIDILISANYTDTYVGQDLSCVQRRLEVCSEFCQIGRPTGPVASLFITESSESGRYSVPECLCMFCVTCSTE